MGENTEKRIDMHVHSHYSADGISSIDALVRMTKKKGLYGFALTDHDFFHQHKKTYDGCLILYGAEITTNIGHLIVLGVDAVPSQDAVEIVEYVREENGVTIPTHPFSQYKFGMGERAFTIGATCVEKFNGTDPYNNIITRLRKFEGTGGSDAHAADEIGLAWTVFPEDVETQDDVFEALRKHNIRGCVSANPFALPYGYAVRKLRKRRLLPP